jgi:hypothetical protein
MARLSEESPTVEPKTRTLFMLPPCHVESVDGGRTCNAFRGARRRHYQRMWTNPNNPHIILASDRVPLSGMEERRTWYNQPTAQISRPRQRLPYRVCSGQQESGSACVSSRVTRTDYVSRVAPRCCGRVRLCRARSFESRPCLWRQSNAL